ncbi:MAG: TrbC/VirB2 family protein, partial [Patescibacteria group bacterium]
MRLKSIVFSAFIVFFSASSAHAAAGVIDTPDQFLALVTKITNWAFSSLLVLAVLFIVYAGYMFLFSQGDVEKAEKAKKQLLYAIIAVAIAILANGIIALTQNLLTGDGSQQPPGFIDNTNDINP